MTGALYSAKRAGRDRLVMASVEQAPSGHIGLAAEPTLTVEDAMRLVPKSVRASHILLMYKGSARSTATRSKAEAQQQIVALQKQLNDGADFGGLARAHSDCPSSQSGGDLGTFGKGQMVPAFETAAFTMDVGQVSGVVETDFGYHLIQRTG